MATIASGIRALLGQKAMGAVIEHLCLDPSQGFHLDLANAFTGESDLAANLLEGERLLAFKAVAKLEYACISFIDLVEHAQDKFEFLALDHRIFRSIASGVFAHFRQISGFVVVAGRSLGWCIDRLHCALDGVHLARWNIQVLGDLIRIWCSAECFLKTRTSGTPFGDQIHHVGGYVNRL